MHKLSKSVLTTTLALTGAAVLWIGTTRAQTPVQTQPPGAQAQPGRGPAGQAPGAAAPAAARGAGGGRGAAAVPGGRGGPSAAPKKHLLVIGMTRGYHHGSTSDGVAMFWNLGKDSGEWDTEIKTDMEWINKRQPGSEAHSLPFFDAVVFVNCTGDWKLDDEQKAALLSYVKEDGKGLVVVHASLDANYNWPEYAEMIGGWFNAHPWGTFDAPVIVEDQTFPATRHFPKYLRLFDEMYSAKQWSRDNVNVLMRMDETKLNYVNPQYGVARTRPDKDEALAWSKMYGKGRVFYSSFGHTKEAWADPLIRTMYLEGVRWAIGRTEGSTTPHPKVN